MHAHQDFPTVNFYPGFFLSILKLSIAHPITDHVKEDPTPATAAACIDIEDGPNAANEAAAAAAAAEDEDVVFPKIPPEHPKGDDNDDEV